MPELHSVVQVKACALLPTNVEALPFSDHAWIKRDDLTHVEYGGNKIRKLEFILADAIKKGSKRIVTFGAIGTNHGVATSMMCQHYGLECIIYLFDQPLTDTVKQNLKLMHYYGAKLIYKGSLFGTVLAYYSSPYRFQRGSYFLFAGGSNVFGCLSFVNALIELRDQVEQGLCPNPKIIVCPVGSSATLAGLSYGCQLVGLGSQVIGIRVAPRKLGPFAACTEQTVYKLMCELHRFFEKHTDRQLPPPQRPVLLDEYFGEGYGVATKKGVLASQKFQAVGIKLEQTYTAKAAAAFLDLLERHQSPVLFWNTYNSRNMSAQASAVDASGLPKELVRFAL